MGGCSGRRFASIKIGPILKAGIGSNAFPIYTAARLMGRPLGRSNAVAITR
jgi:hypothetical protein